MIRNRGRTGTDYCLANTRTWFPNFYVGSAEAKRRARTGICWLSSCFSRGQDWATERGGAEKEKNKKWEQGRQNRKWLCNKRLVFLQIRFLYSDTGGEWFQAADNGPTGSILTFSLVIAELAGWGQGLDLCVSQPALVVTAGGHLM